jgi:hypothetical protein
MSRLQLLLAGTCFLVSASLASAHGWGVGINIGIPLYYPRPYYPYPYPVYGYYFQPYPYYYAPPVAFAEQPAVVVPSAPTYVPVPTAPAPTPKAPNAPAPKPVQTANAPAPTTVVQAGNSDRALKIAQLLGQLKQTQEDARRDAAIELGRLKATGAVEPLITCLSSDNSPAVREAAARGLGLIASPQSLTALIHAAQADSDRDVRHAAQFAVEIIRTHLRGN